MLQALVPDTSAHIYPGLSLEFQLPDGRITRYHRSGLPKPLHWIIGLLGFTGLPRRDRWKLLSHLERTWEGTIPAPSDPDSRIAADWLASIGQSHQAREQIWNPLAQCLTGNPLASLSAGQFVQAVSSLFFGHSSDSRLAQLERTGNNPFHALLTTALQQLGTDVVLHAEMPQLQIEHSKVAGVQIPGGPLLQADWYLSALPHRRLVALLPERLLTRFAYFSQIAELRDLAGLTVQLTCRWAARSPRLILRSRQSFSQLSLAPAGPHLVSVQLSSIGNPSLQALNDAELGMLGTTELRMTLPEIPDDVIESFAVYRNDHAALALHPGTSVLRPIQQSPVENLLVGGAWTDTGWPSNIESAFVSANRCAEIILGRQPQ
jgi:hypothetical protein